MMSLEGSVGTPFGEIKKKTGLIILAGVAVVLGVGYYRARKGLADGSPSGMPSEGTNPATGYPYGSAEDAAALAEQRSFITPVPAGGGPSGTYPSGTYSNNAQWVQAVIEYMMTAGLVQDGSQLSAALGSYITGSPVTNDEKGLIEQAIAVQGFPPVSGSAGYPPSIAMTPTAPATAPAPTPTPAPAPAWMAPPTVRYGSRGETVKMAQRALAAKGYSPGSIDGIFGSKTLAATKAFQRSHGLVVDGIIGPKTWYALLH